MKSLSLLFALLILFAPCHTLAGGPKCEPPNPPDDYQPICPEFGSGAPFPYEFDPNTPPDPAVWDPNHPSALPAPCPEGSLPSDCMTANPVTIDREPLPISVSGGVAPFTWELTGDPGFSLEFATTTDHNNILTSNSACGTATIRVSDSCLNGPQTTEIPVKSVQGQWNRIVPAYCAIPGPPDKQLSDLNNYYRIEGKYKQYQGVVPLPVGGGSCNVCDEAATSGPCDPNFGATECIEVPVILDSQNPGLWTKESLTCEYYIWGVPTYNLKMCNCLCVDGLDLFEWGCPQQ